MREPIQIDPDEPCPEVAAGRSVAECPELKALRSIQKTSGRVQALCRKCGRLVVIAPKDES
jgi:hypothetical protein